MIKEVKQIGTIVAASGDDLGDMLDTLMIPYETNGKTYFVGEDMAFDPLVVPEHHTLLFNMAVYEYWLVTPEEYEAEYEEVREIELAARSKATTLLH